MCVPCCQSTASSSCFTSRQIGVVVTGAVLIVALAVIGMLALNHTGYLAHMGPQANYLAYGTFSAAAVITLSLIIYAAVTYIRSKSAQKAKGKEGENTGNQNTVNNTQANSETVSGKNENSQKKVSAEQTTAGESKNATTTSSEIKEGSQDPDNQNTVNGAQTTVKTTEGEIGNQDPQKKVNAEQTIADGAKEETAKSSEIKEEDPPISEDVTKRERMWRKKSYVHSWRTGKNRNNQTASQKMRKQTARALRANNNEKMYPNYQFDINEKGTSHFSEKQSFAEQKIAGFEMQRKGEDTSFYFEFKHQENKFPVATVCDGHGGAQVSQKLKSRLSEAFSKSFTGELNDETICNGFTAMMEEISFECRGFVGTTLTTAFEANGKIYIANVGDSRAILVKKDGSVYQLTEDADPTDPVFEKTVNNSGHRVTKQRELFGGKEVARVGALAVARDLGIYGWGVSPNPKITCITKKRDQKDKDIPAQGEVYYEEGDFLILATDGYFDQASNQETAKAVMSMKTKDAQQIAQRLVKKATETPYDDISVIVWKL